MGGILARIFKRVLEKTMENSKRLGRQTRPEFEPSTSRLPILRAESFGHWWGSINRESLL